MQQVHNTSKTTKLNRNILTTFANPRNATISFVMSVCPSVRPHRTTRPPLYGFSLNLIFVYFRNSLEDIQVSLQSGNDRFSTWNSLQLYDSMTGSVHAAACNCMRVWQVLYMEQLATVWQYDRFCTWSSLQLYDSMTGSLHGAACNCMTVWQVLYM